VALVALRELRNVWLSKPVVLFLLFEGWFIDNIFQGNPLKRHVGFAAFIKNADCVFIDHCHAGIAGAHAFIEQ
jgi:hypothetical protein